AVIAPRRPWRTDRDWRVTLPDRSTSPRESSWPQPASDPIDRFVHLGGGTGVAEADEMAAVDRIKVDPGRCRDVRFLQHALGEVETVVGEARHVGIEIERAVDRQHLVEPGLRQALEEDPPLLLVARFYRRH